MMRSHNHRDSLSFKTYYRSHISSNANRSKRSRNKSSEKQDKDSHEDGPEDTLICCPRTISCTRTNVKTLMLALLTLVVTILCWIGCCYQSLDVINTYISFPTKVEVIPSVPNVIDMPSITVCIPTVFTREKLKNYSQKLREELEKMSAHEIAEADRNATFNMTLRRLFNQYQNKTFSEARAEEMFQMGFQPIEIIKCSVLAPQHLESNAKENDGWVDCEQAYGPPLKSWSINGMCYTYFSKLNGSNSNDQFQVDINQGISDETGLLAKLDINLKTSEYIDRSKFGDEFVRIHSNEFIPTDSKKASIKPGRQYDMYFNRIEEKLMEPPYQTKCKKYDLTNKITTPQSKPDCIDRCIKKIFVDGCNCNPGHMYIREDLLVGSPTMPVCNFSIEAHLECFEKVTKQNCPLECPDDCTSSFYSFFLFISDSPTVLQINEAIEDEKHKLEYDKNHAVKINILKKIHGDITYKHVPLMNVDLLFGTVGGLASLWCGISLLSLYDSIKEMFVNIWKYLFGENGKLNGYCFGESTRKR